MDGRIGAKRAAMSGSPLSSDARTAPKWAETGLSQFPEGR